MSDSAKQKEILLRCQREADSNFSRTRLGRSVQPCSQEECILRLLLEDDDGDAYGGKSYQLEVDGKKGHKKKTDDEGKLEEEISDGSQKGKIYLWPDDSDEENVVVWELEFGEPESIDTDEGVRSRLAALGYEADEDQSLMAAAIGQFQADNGLDPTGKVDGETRKAMEKAFGC